MRLRCHRSTYVVVAFLAGLVFLANVPGQRVMGPHPELGFFGNGFRCTEVFEHGCPWTWLWRDPIDVEAPDFRSSAWLVHQGVLRQQNWHLGADVLLGLILVLVGSGLFEAWRRRRKWWWHLHLVDLFSLTLAVSLLVAWIAFQVREHRREQVVRAFLEEGTPDPVWVVWYEQEGGPSWLRDVIGDRWLSSMDRTVDVGISVGTADELRQIRTCQHLKRLWTSFWPVPESLPQEFGDALAHLPHLEVVDCSCFEMSDDYFTQFERARQLRGLDVSDSTITRAKLQTIARLTDLQVLDLSETDVGDEELAYLNQLPNLKWLALSGTRVTDAGLAALAGMHGLEYLNVEATEVTDDGVAKLRCSLPALVVER